MEILQELQNKNIDELKEWLSGFDVNEKNDSKRKKKIDTSDDEVIEKHKIKKNQVRNKMRHFKKQDKDDWNAEKRKKSNNELKKKRNWSKNPLKSNFIKKEINKLKEGYIRGN